MINVIKCLAIVKKRHEQDFSATVWTVKLPLTGPYWCEWMSSETHSIIHLLVNDSITLVSTGVSEMGRMCFSNRVGGLTLGMGQM